MERAKRTKIKQQFSARITRKVKKSEFLAGFIFLRFALYIAK